MNLKEFFKKKNQFENNEVGSYEVSSSGLVASFVDLCSFVDISNPQAIKSNTSKGILITKKGNKYLIKLLMFNPPVQLEWTELRPLDDLFNVLDSLATDTLKKNIGSINFKNLGGRKKFFQLALNFSQE